MSDLLDRIELFVEEYALAIVLVTVNLVGFIVYHVSK